MPTEGLGANGERVSTRVAAPASMNLISVPRELAWAQREPCLVTAGPGPAVRAGGVGGAELEVGSRTPLGGECAIQR